jgi:hypothetical protein
MSEDFVSTSNVEPVSRITFPSRRTARTALFEYLEP